MKYDGPEERSVVYRSANGDRTVPVDVYESPTGEYLGFRPLGSKDSIPTFVFLRRTGNAFEIIDNINAGGRRV